LYASSNSGGIAVPTTTTIRAGTLALWAAAFWLAASAVHWFDTVNDLGGDKDWHVWYLSWAVLVVAAGVLGLFVIAALGRRHGGFGAAGLVGLVIASLGVLLSIAVTWADMAWMALIGVGYLITGMRMWSRGLAPKASTVMFATGILIGVAAFIIAGTLEVGWINSYGDYPAAFIIGQVVGQGITALGLIGIGLWLRSEEPAGIRTETPIAA
jgi:hypothetical protein